MPRSINTRWVCPNRLQSALNHFSTWMTFGPQNLENTLTTVPRPECQDHETLVRLSRRAAILQALGVRAAMNGPDWCTKLLLFGQVVSTDTWL
jgi:hypothetical protein